MVESFPAAVSVSLTQLTMISSLTFSPPPMSSRIFRVYLKREARMLVVYCNLRTTPYMNSLTGITPTVPLDLISSCFPHTHSVYELYYNMIISLMSRIHPNSLITVLEVSEVFDTQNSEKVPLSGSQCKCLIALKK